MGTLDASWLGNDPLGERLILATRDLQSHELEGVHSHDAVWLGTELIHEDGLGVGASDSVHGIKDEAEVLAGDEGLEQAKVINLLQGCQVVLHRVDHLHLHNRTMRFGSTAEILAKCKYYRISEWIAALLMVRIQDLGMETLDNLAAAMKSHQVFLATCIGMVRPRRVHKCCGEGIHRAYEGLSALPQIKHQVAGRSCMRAGRYLGETLACAGCPCRNLPATVEGWEACWASSVCLPRTPCSVSVVRACARSDRDMRSKPRRDSLQANENISVRGQRGHREAAKALGAEL